MKCKRLKINNMLYCNKSRAWITLRQLPLSGSSRLYFPCSWKQNTTISYYKCFFRITKTKKWSDTKNK
jgi:hypothetical protein